MLDAGECEPEVIEPMIERFVRDGGSQVARVGEVGQAQPARRKRPSDPTFKGAGEWRTV